MFEFLRRKPKPTIPTDEEIIQGYGRVLEEQAGAIMDEKRLPYPKTVIKTVLVRSIPRASGAIRQHMGHGLVNTRPVPTADR